MRRLLPFLSFATLLAYAAHAQNAGILGDWREPGGSVLEVLSCGQEACMRVMTLRPNTPHLDSQNPDPAKRTQPLCGLRIGYGFQPDAPDRPGSPEKATDGQIYDPKSGKTYHGEMHSESDKLHLRGYIGIPAFGRTETWQRVASLPEPCQEH